MKKLYQQIASASQARENCINSGNREWVNNWADVLDACEKVLPSGSGIDAGTKIDRDKTRANKIVLTAGVHHMNDGGYYDGWTEHTITITPSFEGFDIKISGRDRNYIKDYLFGVYQNALDAEFDTSELLGVLS